MRFFLFPIFAAACVVAGCSYPMDYQTRAVPQFAAGRATTRIAVVGVDEREYLKRKEIDARYVGMFRDVMCAIPYRWVTKSGNPAVDDLSMNLAQGLKNAGYDAKSVSNPDPGSFAAALTAARSSGCPRILVFRVNELESDTQWRTELDYDFDFELLSTSGKRLASNRIAGSIMMPASALPSSNARRVVPKKVGELVAEGMKPVLTKL